MNTGRTRRQRGLTLLLVGAISGLLGVAATRFSQALQSGDNVAPRALDNSGWTSRAKELNAVSLDELLSSPDDTIGEADILVWNLAIAREIPLLARLNIQSYRQTVDQWADHIRHEVDRNLHRFHAVPTEYRGSRAYFNALMMCTVLGQDYRVTYVSNGFSFKKADDLFIHGVIDKRRGTCISLPLLYVALGQRLGYPISAVAVPGHTFCRWDDPKTGERFNMEVSNQGGLTVHDDEYYRHWPFELDPRWEKEHHVLLSLTTRQYASVMVGALAAYFEATCDRASAIRYDALAHWLDPKNRSAFVSLRLNMEHEFPKFFDADELSGKKQFWALKPHASIVPQLQERIP